MQKVWVLLHKMDMLYSVAWAWLRLCGTRTCSAAGEHAVMWCACVVVPAGVLPEASKGRSRLLQPLRGPAV
jgi:hypothetical protein